MSDRPAHSRYINPATDFGFKLIFTDEEITRGFLNDLLNSSLKEGDPKVNIAQVTITGNEQSEYRKDTRLVIFDVRCVTDTGEEFIIEMQNEVQEFFSDRVIFYMARATSRQQRKGLVSRIKADGNIGKVRWNYHLKNIYGVFFMNFKDERRPKPMSHCTLMDIDDHTIDSDIFQYWKIQMPFYKDMKESDCVSRIDRWIYNLSNMDTMEKTLPFADEQPLFMRLSEIAEYANLSEEDQIKYDESLDNYLTYYNTLDYKYKTGKAEGAYLEKLAMAKKMKEMFMPAETIASITGLSLEEIDKIKIQPNIV